MVLNRRHHVFVAAVTLLVAAGFLAPAPADAAPEHRYTLVGFSNTSDRVMDVYESDDGTTFTLAQKDAYRPPTGRVRDPSILKHTDGRYYLTYTTADGANIGFARSADRKTWTPLGNHPIPFCCFLLPGTGDGKGPVNPLPIRSVPGFKDGPTISPFVTKAWAPEWFVDRGKVHVILSLSTGGGFVPYVMTAVDKSLKHWSIPMPLTGIGADHIDTTVVKNGATFHVFTKNEHKKAIEHFTAPSLGGPYTAAPVGDWGQYVEGPAVIRLPDGRWRIFLDAYKDRKYLYSDSPDLKKWSAPKELSGLSGSVRHFSVLREPA